MAEHATDHVEVARLHDQLEAVIERKRAAETQWLSLVAAEE
jgi:hypothetical protein